MNIEIVASIAVAVSTVVMAAATLVITALTRGTWRLYELERNTHRAAAGRNAVLILREAEAIRRQLKGFGPADLRGDPKITNRILARRETWLNTRLEMLQALRNATELGTMSVAHLDVAYEVLSHGMGLWEELLEFVERRNEQDYLYDRKLIMESLRAAEVALVSAYNALPTDLRAWGAEPIEYGEIYDKALAANAEAFPNAHRHLNSSRAASIHVTSAAPRLP